MLPTFVIGLREGLEAALIVGIIAAFIVNSGKREALRPMFAGVALAVAICAAFAIVLRIIESDLPEKQQDGLETILGLFAVITITYMIVWMKRNARGLKQQLEAKTATALGTRSTQMLLIMAFLAVLREGIETAVFLLASFSASSNRRATAVGAALGIATALVLGYSIYRGGARINLAKFFRVTGFVLVLVSAGLLAKAFHSSHEAGWINSFQSTAFNLQRFAKPGSVQSALLSGGLGIETKPSTGQVFVWLAYALPLGLYVLMPANTKSSRLRSSRLVSV